MDEVGLSWLPYVGTEENPGFGTLEQILVALDIRRHSHEPKLVAAHCYEMARARRLGCSQNPHDFQPAHEAAALLAYALPPAAARRHENEGGKALVQSGDRGGYVERSCGGSFHRGHDRHFRALLRLLFQPRTFHV